MGFATESRIAAVWFNLVHITLSTTGILKCLDSTLFSRGGFGVECQFQRYLSKYQIRAVVNAINRFVDF